MSKGYPIVLTGEAASMSDYWGSTSVGFASAIPENYWKSFLKKLFFRVKSNSEGRALRAPYGLAKVEAALLREGFSRNEVIIADPYKLDKVIGERTRILGIYTMDPLGLSYGSGILYWILKLADLPYGGLPLIARSFLYVINHPAVKKYRKNLKIIVGGPASWQIVDTESQDLLGIDYVFEGEFEEIGPSIFKKIMNGENLPRRICAKPVSPDKIPIIRTPSIGGIIEVSRGCGRGCKFCTPAQSGSLRSLPFENHIEKEIKINIEIGGHRAITLHSEEYFRYGSRGIDPNPEKVIELTRRAYKLVKSYGEDYSISTDFTTATVVVQAPKLVKEVSEYMNEDGKWNFIEVGIETGSPELLRRLMLGKVLPFKPEQYPEIVEQGIGILNDNRWIVVGTIIVNLPGETDDDVLMTLELLDRLKKLRVLTFPLPFIPMGALRGNAFTTLDKILEDPLRRELILKALIKAFQEAINSSDLIVRKVENPVVRYLIKYIANSCFLLVLHRYKRKLGSLTEQFQEFRAKIRKVLLKAYPS